MEKAKKAKRSRSSTSNSESSSSSGSDSSSSDSSDSSSSDSEPKKKKGKRTLKKGRASRKNYTKTRRAEHKDYKNWVERVSGLPYRAVRTSKSAEAAVLLLKDVEAGEDCVREAIINLEGASGLLGDDQKRGAHGCTMDVIGLPRSLRQIREQLEPGSLRENEAQLSANLKGWLVETIEGIREAEQYGSLPGSRRRRRGARSSSSPSEKISAQGLKALCNGMLSQKEKDKLKATPGFLARIIVSRATMEINHRAYERALYGGGVAQGVDSLVAGLSLLAHAIVENRTQEGPGLGVIGPTYQLMIRWDGRTPTKKTQGRYGNAQDGRYGSGNNWGGGDWKTKKWGNPGSGGGYAANQGDGGCHGGNTLAGGSIPSGAQNLSPGPPAQQNPQGGQGNNGRGKGKGKGKGQGWRQLFTAELRRLGINTGNCHCPFGAACWRSKPDTADSDKCYFGKHERTFTEEERKRPAEEVARGPHAQELAAAGGDENGNKL